MINCRCQVSLVGNSVVALSLLVDILICCQTLLDVLIVSSLLVCGLHCPLYDLTLFMRVWVDRISLKRMEY